MCPPLFLREFRCVDLSQVTFMESFLLSACWLDAAVTRNWCSVANVQERIGGCSFLSVAIAPANVGRVQGAKEEKCEPWPRETSHFSGET